MEEPKKSEEEQISFSAILELLKNEEETFPARELHRLSGIEGVDLEGFGQVWSSLSSRKKTGLLEDMELLSEGDTVLDFDHSAFVAIDEEDPEIRQLAIRNLWQTEDPEFLPKLIDLLETDQDEKVRAQAAHLLGRYIYLGELGRIHEKHMQAAEQALFQTMEKEQIDSVRQRALESLAYSSDGRVEGLIEDAYDFGEEDWQAAALFAMGRTADNRWIPTVLERLDDPSAELSREAAKAAGELEIDEAIPELLNLLHDDDRQVRLAATWSLSQIGGDVASEALEEYLERASDEDEIDLIEDALENLSFNLELDELHILDFSKDDLEDLSKPEKLDDVEGKD